MRQPTSCCGLAALWRERERERYFRVRDRWRLLWWWDLSFTSTINSTTTLPLTLTLFWFVERRFVVVCYLYSPGKTKFSPFFFDSELSNQNPFQIYYHLLWIFILLFFLFKMVIWVCFVSSIWSQKVVYCYGFGAITPFQTWRALTFFSSFWSVHFCFHLFAYVWLVPCVGKLKNFILDLLTFW